VNELALFAGGGGGILGGILLGWRTICAVEIDPYCRSILLARQRDGMLEPFPIWDDVTTFDGYPWRGRVDVVSGGFPCQDISTAGKETGIRGSRSGLWAEFARIIGEVQPRFVLVENSPMLTFRGLDVVLGDLAALGYDARWGCIPAAYTGACHRRDRIWILANSMPIRWNPAKHILPKEYPDLGELFKPDGIPVGKKVQTYWQCTKAQREVFGRSPIHRVDDGMGRWMDRIKALGNGQVPAVVTLAWEILTGAR